MQGPAEKSGVVLIQISRRATYVGHAGLATCCPSPTDTKIRLVQHERRQMKLMRT